MMTLQNFYAGGVFGQLRVVKHNQKCMWWQPAIEHC